MRDTTPIPLASLRELLDDDAARAHWEVNHDGVQGRALLQPTPTSIRFPLALTGAISLAGQVQLLPLDWRDGTGSVTASIHTIGRRRVQLWTGVLGSSVELGHPDGLAIATKLPTGTTELILTVVQHKVVDGRSVGRVLWTELTLGSGAEAARTSVVDAQSATPVHDGAGPLISVLTPVHNPPPAMLEQCVASVRSQTYSNWELCLVDDGSSDPVVLDALARHAAQEPRVRLYRHEKAQGIAAATNQALSQAKGEYIALLDHDDTLTTDALARIAAEVVRQPDLDMLYSDEAVVPEDGTPVMVRKPAWSPDHMDSLMYTCHVGVYRRELAVSIGLLDSRYDGCQDYDLVLRMAEITDKIAHIPDVLYHWRAHANSTAGGEGAKPYAYLLQPDAIEAHLRRTGMTGVQIQYGQHPGMHRIVHHADPSATVAVVVVDDGQRPPGLEASGLSGENLTVTVCGTNALREAAFTAIDAGAEHLLLCYGSFTALTDGWLRRLLGYTGQTQIAAAAPVVLAPNGRILYAGVVLPAGIPLAVRYGQEAWTASPVVQNLSALDGVVLVRADAYRDLGGLRSEAGNLGLVDLTLRVTDSGRRAVVVPDVRLQARTNLVDNDISRLQSLGARRRSRRDPYYNPHFSPDRADYVEPRAITAAL